MDFNLNFKNWTMISVKRTQTYLNLTYQKNFIPMIKNHQGSQGKDKI